MNLILEGFCEEKLKGIADDSIDAVLTSPPYFEKRKNTYGGTKESDYLEWFKYIAIEIKRVLKPTGSFFLNIKPDVKNGERSLIVFDLVIMLKRELGFFYIDEYSWTKTGFPGKFNGRFKNAFEPVFHFTKKPSSMITFNPLACATPVSDDVRKRGSRKNSKVPKNGSGMALDKSNMKALKLARPSNVIHAINFINQFSVNKDHSAVFPEKLVNFFVLSFSNPGDTVLDPFAGSGTVGVVCKKTDRKYILIEKEKDNIVLINKYLDSCGNLFNSQTDIT